MKLLFLDIDGVLNDHERMPNGYCAMKHSCVEALCGILRAVPDLKIVLSTSWRYMMFGEKPPMTEKGIEYLLCLFGANYNDIAGRVIGKTVSDEEMCEILGLSTDGAQLDYLWLKNNGTLLRREQISRYAEGCPNEGFIVFDDLNLEMDELIQTDGSVGLTTKLANEAIDKIGQYNTNPPSFLIST